ncbi:hypothetical protein HPB51_012963 [Rhipicephalus microplus]|uniref:SH3 domain-containing protein n=1 Tax=Rhipicephalus microplus TaxID=6941 RepID=A0A9J6F2Q3_RHIMP|nr:hypothetical protein HPB51_012963 [Rhipicephalus microplus]
MLAANPDELSFVEQEEMEIVSEGDGDGWIKARNYKGEEGYIPQNYVEIAENQTAGASGESFSSVDYRVETSGDVDGETILAADPEGAQEEAVASGEPPAEAAEEPFVPPADFPNTLAPPGEVRLSMHDGVDDGWWEGELDGRTGIFPSLMVEALKITGEPQTPMEDPSMDTVPPPPAFTPPKPSFLVAPSQVILTQPTPDQEQSGEAEQSAEPAVSVLYNDPDFQLELPTPQQAHYQSQFSGSESETSDHDVAVEVVFHFVLLGKASPRQPLTLRWCLARKVQRLRTPLLQKTLRPRLKPLRPPTPPHQQTVTVVIDSPDEPPREFGDSEDEDITDRVSVVEAPVETTLASEPTEDGKVAEVAGDAKAENESSRDNQPDDGSVAASSEAAAGADLGEPPEELSKEDQANNNATD